jgi:hypothetical protein
LSTLSNIITFYNSYKRPESLLRPIYPDY